MASRLWQTLGATLPVFIMSDGSGHPAETTITDTRIISINIEAGTTMVGLSTAGCTVEVNGYQAHLAETGNMRMSVRLTNHGADLLSAITGRTAEALRYRFTGRTAAHEVRDAGTNRDGTTRLRTTLTGQDWASFVSQLDKGGVAAREEPNLWALYRSMFWRSGIPGMTTLTPWGSKWNWVRFTPDEDALSSKLISTSDVIGSYAADVGSLLRQDRMGQLTAWSHDHLIALADNWQDVNPDPLQRSQVLSPVAWRRPATIPKSIRWSQKREIGNQGTGYTFEFAADPSVVTRFIDVDMNHIWDVGWDDNSQYLTGLMDIMRARYARERETDLTVESVTVDLLALIRRGTDVDRAQVGQLLTLNHGDPLTLGYDWPLVQGVHFVQKIGHKITRDEWTVTLDLVPARHVTGTNPPTDLAGRSWDTAYPDIHAWQTPATSWEASP